MTRFYEGATGDLNTHLSFLSPPVKVATFEEIQSGDVISFIYRDDPKWARKKPVTLEARWVYVLNPLYEKKLHGLSLKSISYNEIKKILPLDYLFEKPLRFYERRLRKLVKSTEAYRTYWYSGMTGIERRFYDLEKARQIENKPDIIKVTDEEWYKRYNERDNK